MAKTALIEKSKRTPKFKVRTYYRWGPFAAAWIADKPFVRAVVRVALVPLVWFARAVVQFGFGGALLLLVTLAMLLVAARRAVVSRLVGASLQLTGEVRR